LVEGGIKNMFLDIIKHLERVIKVNSPTILTGLGAAGVVTTAYLTGKAAVESNERLSELNDDLSFKDKLSETWDCYIPPVISGATSIFCIFAANRVMAKKNAAIYSLLAFSERAFSDYKEQVINEIGDKKEEAIRTALAEKEIAENPPIKTIVFNNGEVMVREAFTGRSFNSSVEIIKRAALEINHMAQSSDYASLNDFYDLVGLEYTSNGSMSGWTSRKIMDLIITSALDPRGNPCVVFDYNYIDPI
jgi:hypothetical protein